jgi:uncharacterized protein
MSRLVFIVVAVVVVVWLLRRALGRAHDAAPGARDGAPPPGAPGDLVNCAHCGVNLPKAEARSAGGRYYCSEEHWQRGPRDG